MTAINRQPTGWLGFLGIKNFGRNPATAADVLAPTWDIAGLYLASSQRYATTSNTPTGLGLIYASFTVPQGEVWHVHSFGVYSAPLAGASLIGVMLVRYFAPQAIYVPIMRGPPGPFAAGQVLSAGIDQPCILSAGDSIGYQVVYYTAPNPTLTQTICYTALPA